MSRIRRGGVPIRARRRVGAGGDRLDSLAMPDPDHIARAKKGDGKERGWRFYLACVLLLLAVIVVFQNTDSTQVKFLFAEFNMPLFFLLIIAIGVGAAIGWLTPKVRRSNKLERDRRPATRRTDAEAQAARRPETL